MAERSYNLRSSAMRYATGGSAATNGLTSTNGLTATPAVERRAPGASRKIATPASRLTRTPAVAPSPMKGGGIGNLTYEQRDELREMFDTVDTQCRGYIPVSKLPEIHQALGLEQPSPDMWVRWKANVDPEGTGKMTYERLEDFVSLRYDEMDQNREILSAFRLFKPEASDIKSAQITFADLKRVSAHLGENIPDDELQEMINIADADNSGSVGFADFMRVMRKSGLF
ncbi:Centrin-1 [Coemansia sp. RSA 562]|nr:Centrin-1 [Coemansia sp. RSA 562]KAJ2239385.1 Centrin-1 [Coemansia sp. RSA 454]KAJ2289868.1 Centrin-1 [Coemansia sp. RSA 355]KAJ2554975.1 Centrin-1 [Coemansia sp. RSA 1878]KAJ2836005.1 Centrin-1 [Coemansia erecta]